MLCVCVAVCACVRRARARVCVCVAVSPPTHFLTQNPAWGAVGLGTLALAVEGWARGERAATVWLDDAAVHIAN